MPNIKLEQSETETYTSHAGMLLVGSCLNKHGNLDAICAPLGKGGEVSNADLIRSYVGLLAQGKSDYEAIENVRNDEIFQLSLGIKQVLSSSRQRQRFDENARTLIENVVTPCNIEMLKNLDVQITPLYTGHVQIDADASPFNNSGTKKEHVSWTYKNFDGYNPMFVYLGQEGWSIAAELHPGSWNGQREFGFVIERAHETARELTTLPLLWRLDSQHDALDNLVQLVEQDGSDFIIKWNKRKESAHTWLKYAQELGHWCHWETPRPGKRVGTFTVYKERKHKGNTYTFRRIMRVTERNIDNNGQMLLISEVEVEGWWTTLESADAEVIALYRDHATSEQFHSEFKTDMDLERLPSGKFDSNDLVLNLGALTYNILKHIGLCGLLDEDAPVRHSAKRRRIKTVMQELMYVAARLIKRSRQLWLRFGKNCSAFSAFNKVYKRLVYE
ncbi:IS1380 family transposase [Candidatus Venteria ishoeyi]|uniref:Transposase DDE domain-containing protein n=1 Tax=Candidatus Venteria ishoeyi TaxID=1899563 RepID=A0A1H6FCM1_9GAMM|nr:IS1380 family transposase [Candidatus Venteria ishoeyi]SEH07832.1 Uncharacterised protein [Candidatus Venteria ishoeyi]